MTIQFRRFAASDCEYLILRFTQSSLVDELQIVQSEYADRQLRVIQNRLLKPLVEKYRVRVMLKPEGYIIASWM